jgi:general secretion pathway protein K
MAGKNQSGVAVVTALLLTTLAITIVASLFWQQQVQVRAIENQRLQLQKQWILRGALDWARLILREDAKFSAIDDLQEPWSVPLSDTKLDQYIEKNQAQADAGSATLSGAIQDAQARLNLTGLASSGQINEAAVNTFARLLSERQQDTSLARTAAAQIATSQQRDVSSTGVGAGNSTDTARIIRFKHIDDLLAIPGFTPHVIRAIGENIIFLPRPTPINANTASAEVLAASLAPLSVADANILLSKRRTTSFRDLNELAAQLPGTQISIDANQVTVSSNFFLVNGRVTLRQAVLQIQALVERNGMNTQTIWVREI